MQLVEASAFEVRAAPPIGNGREPEAYLGSTAIGHVDPDAIRDANLLLCALLPLTSLIMSAEDAGFKAAVHEARQGSSEGGVPIGACLVSAEGKILGQGHNMRIQKGSATLHVSVALIMHAYPHADRIRQKYPLWKMPDAFQPQPTRVQPCTPAFRPVTCAPVHV